jgi:hypothetical protein
MKMNPSNSKSENAFPSFALGVAVGVIAALLLGTEEGKKIAKEAYGAIPEKYKKVPEALFPEKHSVPGPQASPIIEPEETPHHTTFDFEAPPPPPPAVHITHPQKS